MKVYYYYYYEEKSKKYENEWGSSIVGYLQWAISIPANTFLNNLQFHQR